MTAPTTKHATLALPLYTVNADPSIIADSNGAMLADMSQFCDVSEADGIAAAIVAAVNESAALRASLAEAVEALQKIADATCDHGRSDFCPREVARAVLAKIGGGK